jgi:Fe-S-cluster containining protein
VILESKKALLTAVYEVYDSVTEKLPKACHRGCDTCCTQNVVSTTLEGDLMMDYLEKTGRSSLLEQAVTGTDNTRFRPSITLNELAGYCLRQETPPDQDLEHGFTACPFLEDQGCPVYEVRPFSCRCLWSEEICADHGEAVMNPVLVSLNGVFEQIIEHVDSGGLYGNLLDVLRALHSSEGKEAYRLSKPLVPGAHLLTTRPNPGFLVPPLHRPMVMNALNLLWERPIGDLRFRDSFNQVQARD